MSVTDVWGGSTGAHSGGCPAACRVVVCVSGSGRGHTEAVLSAVVPLPSDSHCPVTQSHKKYFGCFPQLFVCVLDENAGRWLLFLARPLH